MNDELTTRLSRQLHDQVDGWHDTPLTLEGVQGRARTIRRRRQALTSGVVAAAVLALAIPVGIGLAGNDTSAPQPAGPSPTRVVDTPTPRADGTFPLTIDAAQGPVPDSGYLVPDDETFVDADGTHELPGRFSQLLPFGDGWVGQRSVAVAGSERIEAVELDADFEEVDVLAEGLELGLVGNADGTRVAWVEGGDGSWLVVNAASDGGETIRSGAAQATTVQGYLSDDRVAVSTTDQQSGDVRHGEAGREGISESLVLEGAGDRAPAFQDVRGISQVSVLVAGQTEFRGDSTCSQVREAAPPVTVVAETCDHGLGAFSPDGRWIIGYGSYYDLGSPTLAILDAFTLEPVVEFRADRGQGGATVLQAVWQDDETLVALVEQQGEQVVVTAHSDGRLEVVSPRLPVRNMSLHYLLPAFILAQN